MKDQYSSNYDDPVIANQRFKNKLDFLERQSIKRQNYLKDLERNFKLSKQTIKSLTEKNPSREQVITQLHQENSTLMQKLKHEFQSICRLNALYLMQCQLRIEESKSYNERIKDFEENMAELRRYLHDKEESFSFVAEKLKKFEELLPNQQLTMYEKLVNYSAIVKQQIKWKDIFSEVLQDRDTWKKQAEQAKQKCKRFEIIVQGMKDSPDFDKFQRFVNCLGDQQMSKTYNAIVLNNAGNYNPPQNKNHANQSTNVTYSDGRKLQIEPNVELIRLMKKQKLSNKILQSALTEAIDKNLELIQCNKKLIQSNDDLRFQIDYIIADMVVLSHALKKYDENYRTKLRVLKHRAKCDLDLPSYRQIIDKYKNNSLQQAQQILFTKMRTDVEELTEYIALFPIHKTNNIRSYESPRKTYKQTQNLDVSMNDKQLQVSEI